MPGKVLRYAFTVCAAMAFAGYVAVQIMQYRLPAFAADEIAFYVWSDLPDFAAGNTSPVLYFMRPNLAGYGAQYWNLYINFKYLFGSDAIWAMRAAAFVVWLSVPVAVIVSGNRVQAGWGWMVGLLWCTLPMAWWTGKVTGPELFSVGLATQGVMLLGLGMRREQSCPAENHHWIRLCGWLLIGAGLAIKLTTLPVALFAFIALIPWHLVRDAKWGRLINICLLAGVAAVIGFILINPLLIVFPTRFVKELGSLPKGEVWSWNVARMTLSNQMWNWDGVFCGGLTEWSLAWPAAVPALAAVGLVRVVNLAALILSVVLCWLMMIAAGSSLGWYWFGAAALLPAALLCSMPDISDQVRSRRRKAAWCCTAAAVALNAWFQAPRILDHTNMKREHARAIAALPEVQRQLDAILSDGRKYDRIVDFSEITYMHGLCIPADSATEIIQSSPVCVPKLTPDWEARLQGCSSGNFERCNRGILADPFTAVLQLGEKGSEGKKICMLVSKRLASKHAFAGLENFSRDWILKKSPGGTQFHILADLPYTWIVEVVPGDSIPIDQNSS